MSNMNKLEGGRKNVKIDPNSKQLWDRISNEEVIDTINWFSLEYAGETELYLSSVGVNGLLEAKKALKDDVASFLVVTGCLIQGKNDFRTITLLISWIPRLTIGPKRARSILHLTEIVKFFDMPIVYIIEPRTIDELSQKYVEKRVNEIRGLTNVIGRYIFTREATTRRQKEARKKTTLPILKELLFCDKQLEKVKRKTTDRLRELFKTERFFVKSMQYFQSMFVDSIRLHGYRELYIRLTRMFTVIIGVNTPLLREFDKIYEIPKSEIMPNHEFTARINSLDREFFTDERVSNIIDAFRKHCPNLKKYVDFTCSYGELLEEIKTLLQKDPELQSTFRKIDHKLRNPPYSWRVTQWTGFLIMPIQRPMRYPMMLNDLLDDTLKMSDNASKIGEAAKEAKKLSLRLNEQVDEYTRKKKTEWLIKKFFSDDLTMKNKEKVLGYYPIKIHYSHNPQLIHSEESLIDNLIEEGESESEEEQHQQHHHKMIDPPKSPEIVTGSLLDFGEDNFFSDKSSRKQPQQINYSSNQRKNSKNNRMSNNIPKQTTVKKKVRNGELYIFEDQLIVVKFDGGIKRHQRKHSQKKHQYRPHTKIFCHHDLRNPDLQCERHTKMGTMMFIRSPHNTSKNIVKNVPVTQNTPMYLEMGDGEEGITYCSEAVEMVNSQRNKSVGRASDHQIMRTQRTTRVLHRSRLFKILIPPKHIISNSNSSSYISNGVVGGNDLRIHQSAIRKRMCWMEVSADLRVKIYETNGEKLIQQFSIVGCEFGKFNWEIYRQKIKIMNLNLKQKYNNNNNKKKTDSKLLRASKSKSAEISPRKKVYSSNRNNLHQRRSTVISSNRNSNLKVPKKMLKKKRKSFSGGMNISGGRSGLSQLEGLPYLSNGNDNNNNNNRADSLKKLKFQNPLKNRKNMKYCWFYISPYNHHQHSNSSSSSSSSSSFQPKNKNIQYQYIFQTNNSILELENWMGILEILESTRRVDDVKGVLENYKFMTEQQILMLQEEKKERSAEEKLKRGQMEKKRREEKLKMAMSNFNIQNGHGASNNIDFLQSGFEVRSTKIEERIGEGEKIKNVEDQLIVDDDDDFFNFFEDSGQGGDVEVEIIKKKNKKKDEFFF